MLDPEVGFTALAVAGARELLGRLDRPARVVELGCGDGTTARLLTEAGHDVLGIDASRAFIALARKRAPRRQALRRDGLLLFDLPGPRRVPRTRAAGLA